MMLAERPKRLCMVVHGPYPESRVSREAAAALEMGYQVDVIATRRPGEAPHELIDGARLTRLPVGHVQGAGILRMLGEYAGFTALASAVVAARTVSRPYDVVHVHAPPDFLIVSALIPRLRGSRVILDIHDRSPDMFSMRFPGRLSGQAKALLQLVERLAARCADVVLTVHDPYVREIVALGTPAAKTIVVMNSLDEGLLPEPKAPAQVPFRIVYHGTLTPHYGVHLLLDAVAELVERGLDAYAEIMGEGDSVPELKARVAELNLTDRIAIEGTFLPHRTVLERVNGATVGVVPNLPIPLNRFALSSKLFEYVVLGVPVVSAALPTIQEHFSDDEIRFFEPGNATSLADALLAVAHDPEAAAERAERARSRYASYRWDVNRQRYVGILDRLAAGGSPVGSPDP